MLNRHFAAIHHQRETERNLPRDVLCNIARVEHQTGRHLSKSTSTVLKIKGNTHRR